MLLCATSTARAGEVIAAYPTLPRGYSSIRVFDGQRRFTGRIMPDKRYWVSIDRIPAFLQKAIVAIEDSRFYEHGGIDIRGIARAIVKDVAKGRLAEGGSTITQQLIKNRYLSSEKTIDRKLKEAELAMEYERKYSKKQILEMYLNEIYFGNGAWGIAQAARLYFDKSPEELTDAECSLLAGVPKNPGRYNPLGKSASVTARRDLVLERMVKLKMITAGRQKYLRANPPTVVPRGQAPYYLNHIRNLLVERYGPGIIEQGGVDVITAMDLGLQKLAEKALSEGVKRINPQLQGALLCMDPNTGDLLAAVGGVDFAEAPYDRAFLARRQPGSAIKPLIYAAAMEKGFSPDGLWNDAPVAYSRGNNETWQPRNYEGKIYGDLSLRQALAYSNNVIAVKLLDAVGIGYFTDFAGEMGLSLHPDRGLSLALGTEEVTLNSLVRAYAPFASGGWLPESRSIIRIFDRRLRTSKENPPAYTQVIPPATAYVMTNMLKDVISYGTAKGLAGFSRKRPSAGKTGTTDDYRDAWFIGYTPQLITGVWVGYDKPRPGGRGFTGGAIAAPIWVSFMEQALAGRPAIDFPVPGAVVYVAIDPATGFLTIGGCPQKMDEYRIMGTEPAGKCPGVGEDILKPSSPAIPLPGSRRRRPGPWTEISQGKTVMEKQELLTPFLSVENDINSPAP